jgi:hypothetical protein
MELNLTATDIWSLEPIDHHFRPLRLNYQLDYYGE